VSNHEIQIWDETADNMIGVAHTFVSASFRDARNECGTGRLTVPADAIFSITPARELFKRNLVIRHVVDGVPVFAWQIEEDSTQIAADNPTITATGRGLASLYEAAAVYPGRGLKRSSSDRRLFGWGAFVPRYDNDGVTLTPPVVADIPAGFNWPVAGGKAAWGTNLADAPPGQQYWLQNTFSLANGSFVRIDAVGDNAIVVWLDGVEIINQDPYAANGANYARVSTWHGNLSAGVHRIAMRGENMTEEGLVETGFPLAGPASVSLRLASAAGNDDLGTTIKEIGTGVSAWSGTFQQPGWTVGDVLMVLQYEAATRGEPHLYNAPRTFTAAVDSNGVPWPHNIDREFGVGTDNLLTVQQALAEGGIDFWVDGGISWNVAQTRGVDRTAEVTLIPAGNLGAYSLKRSHKITNAAIVKTRGGFVEVVDTASVALHGRREDRLDLASTTSTASALASAEELLSARAYPALNTDGDNTEIIPWAGAEPYKDFGIGDSISVPDGDGGYVPATVMAFSYSVTQSSESWQPELDLAQTGARSVAPLPTARIAAIAKSGGAASFGGTVQSATN
jgi:hypothetical protein